MVEIRKKISKAQEENKFSFTWFLTEMTTENYHWESTTVI